GAGPLPAGGRTRRAGGGGGQLQGTAQRLRLDRAPQPRAGPDLGPRRQGHGERRVRRARPAAHVHPRPRWPGRLYPSRLFGGVPAGDRRADPVAVAGRSQEPARGQPLRPGAGARPQLRRLRAAVTCRWSRPARLPAAVPLGSLFPQELLYMKKTGLYLALAAALGFGITACTSADGNAAAGAESASAADSQENPFTVQSELPLQYPHFDRIKDSHFGPAFDAGMAEQLKEIQAITSNSEAPTFENTIIALENSGQLFSRARAVFFNLVGTDTNDTRKAIQAEYSPKFAAHRDAIMLDGALFERIKTLYEGREGLGLDAEATRLVERYYTDFVRAGANLSDADKARLK